MRRAVRARLGERDNPFQRALDRWCNGRPEERTLALTRDRTLNKKWLCRNTALIRPPQQVGELLRRLSAINVSAASAQAAVVQPACRPITSRVNTLVEVRLIAARSSAASRSEVATYFATEPKPGEQSVIGRSLSIVLGMPMHTIG